MDETAEARTRAGMPTWLDGASRDGLRDGRFASMVARYGLTGATTGPVATHRAVLAGAYDGTITGRAGRRDRAEEAIGDLLVADAVEAADRLGPAGGAPGRLDGRVTVTLPPWELTSATDIVAGAEKLVAEAGRERILVGLPATPDGREAVTHLVAAGIGVDVGPIFSPARLRAVAAACEAGWQRAAAAGRARPAGDCVASVGLSPVDTDVDKRLWNVGTDAAAALRGSAAIANAKLVYAAYCHLTTTAATTTATGEGHRAGTGTAERAGGAAPALHLAWAFTEVRDPYYVPTHYLDALGTPAVTAKVTPQTLEAMSPGAAPAHGGRRGGTGGPPGNGDASRAVDEVRRWREEGEATVAELDAVGVSLTDAVDGLESRDLPRSDRAWEGLRDAVAKRMATRG